MRTPGEIARAYDDVADSYDEQYDRPIDAAEDIVISQLLPWRAACVLDLGCGTGKGYELLKAREMKMPSFTGVDISPRMIELAKQRYPEARWIRADMLSEALEVPAPHREVGGRYDLVMSLFCSPNYGPFGATVKTAFRHLAPGGRAFLMAITKERYKRFPSLVFEEDTIPVTFSEAAWQMEINGFTDVKVRGLGNTLVDALAPSLQPETVASILRQRLDIESHPIYLIVTGRKSWPGEKP